MMSRPMNLPVFRKMLFTVTFPQWDIRREHVSRLKMHSLLKRQLTDLDVIETIEHLFHCQRCFENFRHVRKAFLGGWRPRNRAAD